MAKWQQTSTGNYVLNSSGNHFISYNPNTKANAMARGLDAMTGKKGGEETALVRGITHLILMGDFRKDYEPIIEDWDKCLAFFRSKPEFRSNWTCCEPN